MPTFPVAFTGDVGNLAQFASQIERTILGTERAIDGAFARLAAKQTGISSVRPMSSAALSGPGATGTFLSSPSAMGFDQINNRVTAQAQLLQRQLVGWQSKLNVDTGKYESAPTYSTAVVKDLNLISNAFGTFTRQMGATGVINNLMLTQQKAFTNTESSLRNLADAYIVAGETQARAMPRSGIAIPRGQALPFTAATIMQNEGADALRLLRNLETTYGIDLTSQKRTISRLSAPTQLGWTRGTVPQVADSMGNPVQGYRLSATAVRASTQQIANILVNEVLPQVVNQLPIATQNLLAGKAVLRGKQGQVLNYGPIVQGIMGRADESLLGGVDTLDASNRQFLARFPQISTVLQKQGLGLGAKAGTEDFFKNAKQQGFEVNQVYKDFEKNITHVSGSMRDLTGITGQWSYALDRNSNIIDRWGNRLGRGRGILGQTGRDFLKVIEWTVATSVVFGALGTAVRSVSQINTLNEDLQRFGITAKLTGQETQEMFKGLADIAYQTATPLTELVKAADDIALATRRANQSTRQWRQDILDMARAVGILTNISGLDTVAATDLLTASMKQLGLTASETIDLLNKATAAAGGQANAITDIMQALGTVSEAAESANLNWDEQIAAVQVLAQVTGKTAADVATAFKNLFGALASTGAEKKLKEFGISVRDAEGNIRPFLEVYKDISDALKTGVIPEGRLNEVLRAISGGPRRAPDAAALLSNISKVYEVSKISASATNEALVANAKILDTNNAKLRQLQVTIDAQVFEKLNKTIQDLTGALLTLSQAFAAVFGAMPSQLIQVAIQLGIILGAATLLHKAFQSIGNTFFINKFLTSVGWRKIAEGAVPAATMGAAATAAATSPLVAQGSVIGRSYTGTVTTMGGTTPPAGPVYGPTIAPGVIGIQNRGFAQQQAGRISSILGQQEQVLTYQLVTERNILRQRIDAYTAYRAAGGTGRFRIGGRFASLATESQRLADLESAIALRTASLGGAFVPINLGPARGHAYRPLPRGFAGPVLPRTDAAAIAAARRARNQLAGSGALSNVGNITAGLADIDQAAKEFSTNLVTSTAVSWRTSVGKALKGALRSTGGKAGIGALAGAGVAAGAIGATGGDQGLATLLAGIGFSAPLFAPAFGPAAPAVAVGGLVVGGLATAYQMLSQSQEDNKKKVLELRQASYESLQQYRISEAATRAYAGDLADIANSLKTTNKGTEAYIGLQHQYGELLVDNMAATDTLNSSFDVLKKNLIGMADAAVKAGEQLDSAFQNAINVLKTGAPVQSLTPAIQKLLIEGLSRGILDAEGKITYKTNLAPVTGSYTQGLGGGLTGRGQYGTQFAINQGSVNLAGTGIVVPEGTERIIDLLNLTVQDIRDIYKIGLENTGIPINNQTVTLLMSAVKGYQSELGNDFQPIVDSFGASVDKFGVGIAQMSNLITVAGANAEAARTYGVIGAEDYSNIQSRIDIASRIQAVAAAAIASQGPAQILRRTGEVGTSAENQFALGINQAAIDPNKLRDIQNKLLIDQTKPFGLATGLISEDQAVEYFKEIVALLPKELQRELLSSDEVTRGAARQYFSGIIEEAKGASLSIAEALTIKEDIFSGINSAVTGLNQKLFELESRKRGGEFEDNIAGYQALKSQYEATKAVLIDFNRVAQEGSAKALNVLADKIDDTVTGMDGLVTETLSAQSAVEGATVNWSNFGEILAAVAETAGLTGDQITTLGQKLIAAAKAQEILSAASLRAVGVLITEAATMGYTAYVAEVMKTSFINARTGEGYASSQQAQMDLRRIATGTGTFLRNIIADALAALNDITSRGLGTGFAAPPSTSTSTGTKGPGLDISELDIPEEIYKAANQQALLTQAVANAKALQAKIPGAAKEASNDIVSLLYGTKKVMEVRGVREDLLRRALEELADIERKRLELDAKADIIQRIRVGAGSFAAIANVPLSSQTGISIGSPQGPITVNLNVNGTVMTPAQLAQWADRIGAAIGNQITNGS